MTSSKGLQKAFTNSLQNFSLLSVVSRGHTKTDKPKGGQITEGVNLSSEAQEMQPNYFVPSLEEMKVTQLEIGYFSCCLFPSEQGMQIRQLGAYRARWGTSIQIYIHLRHNM